MIVFVNLFFLYCIYLYMYNVDFIHRGDFLKFTFEIEISE